MEHIHEMAEEVAAEVIEQEKDEAQELLDSAAEQERRKQEREQQEAQERVAAAALRQFFGIPEPGEEESRLSAWRREQERDRLQKYQAFILGLRALADFYQSHPEVEMPQYFSHFTIYNVPKSELGKVARAFGQLEKVYDESSFRLRKDFGGDVVLETYSTRESVCERVKVGEKLVPAHVIPARPAEDARIVEEEVVGVYEWVCPEVSLLKPQEESQAASQSAEALPEFDEAEVPQPQSEPTSSDDDDQLF